MSHIQSFSLIISWLLTNGMFGWDDFGKDERKMREKIVGKCVWLEGKGKEKMVGIDCFLFGSTKFQSLQNREKTRQKTFVHVKRIFGLWYFATCSSLFFSFFFFLFFFFVFFFLFFFFILRSSYFLYSLWTSFLLLLFFVF